MQESYQLTKHPVGTKREFWAMSWPLMLGLLSATIMMFVDRLFVAKWHPLALNAVVTAGLAYYMFLVVPLGIVEIAEVLTGRLHGEERHNEIGKAVWQMVMLSMLIIPLMFLVAWLAPALIFSGSIAIDFESTYFRILLIGGPIQCMCISLGGFFIGTGNVKHVTIAAILANIANIVLDYLLIFGAGPIPSLGIAGAAIATVASQVLQLTYLLCVYWLRHNRQKYGTMKLGFSKPFLCEGLRIGIPSGLARNIEVVAHFIFFRLVMMVGQEQMTLVAIGQSLYLLASFIIDAQSKSASAIAANLFGANQQLRIGKVIRSGMTLHSLFFLVLLGIAICLPEQIFNLFSASEDVAIIPTPELMNTFRIVLICVSLFFLVDGFGWIMLGVLTAAKDTVFIFWTSVIVNWFAYVPPTIWLIGWKGGNAATAWMIVVFVTTLSFACYLWRYLSGKWQVKDQVRAVL